jgi:site-specific recombinase XerD
VESDPQVEGFLALLAARRAPRTVEAYRRDLRSLASWLGRPPGTVTIEELERYLAELRAEGLAGSTIARRAAAIRSFFRHLVLLGQRTDNPAAELDLPRRDRRLPRTLSPGEAERLVEAANGTGPRDLRDRALVELLYGAGLRVSEAVGLDLGRVDLEERLVRPLGKGGKERLVPLGREAVEALRRYLARGRPFLDRRRRPELFLNAQGGALTRACSAASPSEPASSRSGSTRTCCATPSPRICSRAAPTCAPCRRCWAMPTSRRRSSTRTSPTAAVAMPTSRRIRTHSAAAIIRARGGSHGRP